MSSASRPSAASCADDAPAAVVASHRDVARDAERIELARQLELAPDGLERHGLTSLGASPMRSGRRRVREVLTTHAARVGAAPARVERHGERMLGGVGVEPVAEDAADAGVAQPGDGLVGVLGRVDDVAVVDEGRDAGGSASSAPTWLPR